MQSTSIFAIGTQGLLTSGSCNWRGHNDLPLARRGSSASGYAILRSADTLAFTLESLSWHVRSWLGKAPTLLDR